jgi:hypothetical protein
MKKMVKNERKKRKFPGRDVCGKVWQFEISAYKLAKDIGIPQTRVSEIVKGHRRIASCPSEVTADTTKLHIKGDSCWIEYVSAGTIHSKKKDGSYLDMPTAFVEMTDTLKMR